MDVFTQKWAIISLLEYAAEGSEFHFTDTPLHLTFAGVFGIDHDSAWLGRELEELVKGQQSVGIEAAEEANFGPDGQTTVMKVKKTGELMKLYEHIYTWLTDAGAEFLTPSYEGGGYEPHCTYQKTGRLMVGDKRSLTSISLIDLFPGGDEKQRRIAKTIRF